MTSEIRTNTITSRAGLSTVTFTDSGPMFSGITTFVDNSTFSVGTGGTIHAPATNVMALGTNNIDAIKIDSSGNVNISGILTASSFSGIDTDKISEGNTEAEVVDTGSDGHFKVTTEGGERFRINSTGQVLIGIDNAVDAEADLQIHSATSGNGPILNMTNNTGDCRIFFGQDDSTSSNNAAGQIRYSVSSNHLAVYTNKTEKIRILSTGELILGHTAAPFSDGDPLQLVSTSGGEGIIISNYSASDYGNQIAFLKSRSAAVGNTILQSGDRIGDLNFYGNDGSGRSLGAQIQVRVSDTPSNNNTPSTIYFNTGLNQSMSTKLMVTPTDVEIRGSAKVILPSSSSGDYIRIYAGSGTGKWDLYSSGSYLRISDNDSAGSVRLDTRLGTGTAASHAQLVSYVNATGGIPANGLIQTDNANHALQLWNGSNSASYVGMMLECRTSGASGWLIANEWDSAYKGDLIFRGRNGGSTSKERMHLTHDGKIYFGSISDWGSVSGIDNTDFAFTFSNSSSPTHPNANNRDTDFVTALQVHTPVKDGTNTPAIVIKETGGQMSGRNSLMFFNGDYNSGAGYIKSRIYTQVGSGYNSTQFYIDVADSSKNHQQRFRIDTSGNFHGSGTNSISDQRLKKDIATITDPLTKIKGLTGRTFKWNEDSTKFDDKTKFGFVAQEVETILPELVSSDGLMHFDADDKLCDEFEAVSHSKSVVETGVIPITVEAIKELITKVETLEQDNITLRARVTNLEGN